MQKTYLVLFIILSLLTTACLPGAPGAKNTVTPEYNKNSNIFIMVTYIQVDITKNFTGCNLSYIWLYSSRLLCFITCEETTMFVEGNSDSLELLISSKEDLAFKKGMKTHWDKIEVLTNPTYWLIPVDESEEPTNGNFTIGEKITEDFVQNNEKYNILILQ